MKVEVDFFVLAAAALAIWFAPLEDDTSLARAMIHNLTSGEVPARPPKTDER